MTHIEPTTASGGQANFVNVVDPNYKQPEATLTTSSNYTVTPKKIRNKRSYKTELRALTRKHRDLVLQTVFIGAVGLVGWALAIWFIIAYFIK